MFTPMHGSLMNVNITTLDSTSNVIRTILNKFKVDNSPNEFCLCAIKASGGSCPGVIIIMIIVIIIVILYHDQYHDNCHHNYHFDQPLTSNLYRFNSMLNEVHLLLIKIINK